MDQTIKKYADKIPECPCCRAILNKFPTRKTKCNRCGQYFYLMLKPGSNTSQIVDEKRRNKWQKENKLYSYIEGMKRYGLSDKNLIDNEIKRSIKLSDAIWNLYNTCLFYNAGNFEISSWIYYDMARFCTEEGDDPIKLVKLALEFELLSIEQKQSNLLLDAVICSGNNPKCVNCSPLNGKCLPIREAIKAKMLPHQPCDDAYCTAFYSARVKRNKDGFVITQK